MPSVRGRGGSRRRPAPSLLGWKRRAGSAVYAAAIDRTATLGGLVRHLARQVLDMDGPLPAALFAESPHLSDAELDELDAIINAAAADTEGKA